MTKPAESRCDRCGAPVGIDSASCAASGIGVTTLEKLRCRDREMGNLRSLLRSQTRKVEMALEYLSPICEPEAERAKELLLQMLEALA